MTAKSPVNLQDMSTEETWRLVHDLQVHQLELEMLNEELRRAHAELAIAQSRYFELFDVAPVGHVVIDEHGLIADVNLATSSLLGCPGQDLVAQPFTRIITSENQDVYYLQRERLLESGTPLSCDLRLRKHDGTSFWAHLEGTVARNGEGAPVCRAVPSDISERKRAEAEHEKLQAQLSHARKTESVGRLAGGVAGRRRDAPTPLLRQQAGRQAGGARPHRGRVGNAQDAAAAHRRGRSAALEAGPGTVASPHGPVPARPDPGQPLHQCPGGHRRRRRDLHRDGKHHAGRVACLRPAGPAAR